MRFRVLSVLVLLFIISASSPSTSSLNIQVQVHHIMAQSASPSGRDLPGFEYDPINERVMMFGGGNDDDILAPYNDNWILNTTSGEWTELALDNSPVYRSSTVMAYDSADEVIILFGGHNGTAWASDTWIFDCNTELWTEVTPAQSPHGRGSHAMVYDAENEKALLFSGYSEDGPVVADTWAYDYTDNTWTEMNPSESPHARYGAGYVYDIVTKTMIIFGGNSNGYFSDTWSYDYATDTWTELNPAVHPQALKWSRMTYDSTNHKTILFGGNSILSRAQNETWIYDSTSNLWEQRQPTLAPPSREAFGFTYDSVNEKAVLFGGTTHNPTAMNDTWAYDYDANTWTELGQPMDTTQTGMDPIVLVAIVSLGIVSLIIVIVCLRRRYAMP
ncbi:MAG: kelch repeat-containing protein [Candidatus Thorarchaeota archaeon]|nr:kelch repeat-containing protein [Candidatus Thorarchaeota archaeon]